MAKTLTVMCSHPCGLSLRVFEFREGELGSKIAVQVGDTLTLNAGRNENVDADFINAWLAQHKDSDLVKNSVISILPATGALPDA